MNTQFEQRCVEAATDLDDRLWRYISSPQEHDLMGPTVFPFVFRAMTRHFPWEVGRKAASAPPEDET